MRVSRRKFLKETAVAGTAAAILPSTILATGRMSDRIRIGVIGTGLRGQGLIGLVLRRDDVEIPAICDIDERMLEMTLARFDEADRRSPKIYSAGEKDYLNLLDKENLDGVIITTPWRWHTPMAIAAMESGKHVGVEVPACLTVDECWNLVRMSEKTEKFCMILENVCYRRDVMAVLNMVREGLFGELLHCQGGYQHDLRRVKFNDGENPYGGGVEYGEKGFSEARWRTQHSVDRNGDLYPTHGGGPVAQMLDINRGNRFVHLTSTATQSRGLHQYIVAQAGPDHPNAKVKFKLGDIVTTVIKCAKGETVVLSHDTNSPRPYSLNFCVQGTRGLWMKDNNSIYIEGLSPEDHKWEPDEPYLKKYDHPLWKRFESKAAGAGHGGMDFFIVRAFLESIKRDVSPPLDVYDAASMSVISPLSEQSIANGSAPMKFPDFTRGKWKTNKPIFALNDVY
ncbi:MAG: glycosyl hydrolase [Candidatus Marinimicrobia bacterium]|nr:glycosyl hydrolase [Candidatus Neomarinimicrobiota bacterium]|tara:strand:+ start:9521 stop:10879 length:1359 start_codon:yes stop_codon:yes gene_type:complete